MIPRLRNWRSPSLGLAVALVMLPALALAAEGRAAPKYGEYNPEHQTVDLFQAIEQGQIEVKLIPKDSTESQVLIENKTKQPLNVKLPEAFAGVPVLAQLGVGGGGRTNRNSGYGQGVGGGWGGMGGMGMGGMGMGGGMWNVAPEQVGANAPAMLNVVPEKVGKLQVTTVCLDHGRPEPRPAMQYEIKPIEQYTDKTAVQELCRMLGSGQLDQRAAQAAAWNLNNGMSWQELAAKEIRHVNGAREPYFAPQEIQAAMRVATAAGNLAQQREKQQTSDESISVSSR